MARSLRENLHGLEVIKKFLDKYPKFSLVSHKDNEGYLQDRFTLTIEYESGRTYQTTLLKFQLDQVDTPSGMLKHIDANYYPEGWR